MRPAPEGWVFKEWGETFSSVAGPFYYRKGDAPGIGFYAEQRHANMGGVVHGGMLLTLADMSLFDTCFRKTGDFVAVTVSLNSEFIRGGPVGAFIVATGELIRSGRSLSFVRGVVTADDDILMTYSGTLKRLGPPPS